MSESTKSTAASSSARLLYSRFRNARRRPNELLISLSAFALLAAMTQMVHELEIPQWEIATFEVINSLPDMVYYIIWPFMQYGVFVTIPFVSAIAFYYKRYRLATLLLVGGVGIYYLARVIKELFPRGRPGDLLDGVRAREEFAPWSTGFTSGHTAVAATIATFSHYYLSKRWRTISIATLAIVVIGRIYVGAHLPLDVFGGVALGVAVASLTNFIVGIPAPASMPVEDTPDWIKQHRPRHPGDIIRMAIASVVFVVTTLFALTGIVGPIEESAFRLVNYMPTILSPLIQLIMQFGALAFVFVAATVAVITRHYRLSIKILSGGVGVWILARIAKILVDRERPFYILNEIVERASNSGVLGFPSGHASVAALIATVASPYVSKNWSRIFWAAAWITAFGRLFVGAHLPLDVIAGLSLGWFVGSLMNIGFGTPAKPWPRKQIIRTLDNAGLRIKSINQAMVDARGSVPLFATTTRGRKLFIKVIDSEHRNADLLYRLWRYLTLRGVEDEAPFSTAKQLAEHEAYVSIQAAQAGVRTPKVLLASPVSRDASVMVTEKIDGQILSKYKRKMSKRLLKAIWQQVATLHHANIAHRDLRTTNIMIDTDNHPWLIDFSFSHTAANELQRRNDLIELLVTLCLQAKVTDVVASSIAVFGEEKIRAVRPYLQESVLTSYSRKRLVDRPELLDDIENEINAQTHSRSVPKAQMTRVNWRWLGFLGFIGLAVYYLIPQLGELDESIEAIRTSDMDLLVGAILASLLTYVMSAIVVHGATLKPIRFRRTFLVQFATTALNRITPKGVGGAVLLERYLEKNGLTRIESTSAVALVYTAGAAVHLFLTLLTITILDPSILDSVSFSTEQIVLVAAVLVMALFGLILIKRVQRMFLRWGAETIHRLKIIVHQPRKMLQLFGGSAGVTLAYALAFSFSIDAFGGGISFPDAVLVYLASNIFAAAAPTPGGLGATEAALVVGLTLYELPISQAITAVLMFRLITFWLPVIPGFFALRWLQRRKLI